MKRIISSVKALAPAAAVMSGLWSGVPDAMEWIDIILQAQEFLSASTETGMSALSIFA